MMKFAKKATVACTILVWAGTVHAQEVGRYAVSLGVSSVGLTGGVAYRPSEKWRLRAMLSGAPKYRTGEDLGGISYKTETRLGGGSLLADRYLFRSERWHQTFGTFLSGTQSSGTAIGAMQIGNNTYTTNLNA